MLVVAVRLAISVPAQQRSRTVHVGVQHLKSTASLVMKESTAPGKGAAGAAMVLQAAVKCEKQCATARLMRAVRRRCKQHTDSLGALHVHNNTQMGNSSQLEHKQPT
eukprot:GHRQ01024984.1.p2 GENE.GHRQ01024984.1~~GHRQ01024984.1.p2  ORF type:complete len:107 (+),score=16.37 GHRQ01024984.1:721-1041(+)